MFPEVNLSQLQTPATSNCKIPGAGDWQIDIGTPDDYSDDVVESRRDPSVEDATASPPDEDLAQLQKANRHAVDSDAIQNGPKRKWDGTASREKVPEYDTKRSKQQPDQQRAIMWMTRQAKQHFDR